MISQLIGKTGRILVLVILCVVIACQSTSFLSASNIINVIRQSAIAIILAVGLTMVIITAGIDLSIGSVVSLTGVVASYMLTKTGIPLPLVIFLSLCVGIVVGILNGVLINYVRMPPFIATYGMLWIAQGLATGIMRGDTYFHFPKIFLFLGSGHLLGVPVPIILMVVLVLISYFVLHRTTFGCQVYAIGENPEAARFSGIPYRRVKMIVYSFSGFCASFAGLVYIARLDSCDSGIGEIMLLPAIAAITVGGISLFGGQGSVTGTVLGGIIMTVLLNGMNLLNVSSLWQPFATGTIIMLAVTFDQLTQKEKLLQMISGSNSGLI